MSDIQLEADEVTEILNTFCRHEALGRDGTSSKLCTNVEFVISLVFFSPDF